MKKCSRFYGILLLTIPVLAVPCAIGGMSPLYTLMLGYIYARWLDAWLERAVA